MGRRSLEKTINMAYKQRPITRVVSDYYSPKKPAPLKAVNESLMKGAGYASSKFTDLGQPAKEGFDSAMGDAKQSEKLASKAAKVEEREAASKVIDGDGFGDRDSAKPVAIEDIDVFDESDLEFDLLTDS
tara:strand:- start:10 stop:399 length:390 start_codon:yes stop_codon:yes gene_type:complete